MSGFGVVHIRCGDTVLHYPSGETWTVAYADYERDALAWMGWPEGFAKITDCILLASATDAEHREHVERWSKLTTNDHRPAVVRRLYGPTPQPDPPEAA